MAPAARLDRRRAMQLRSCTEAAHASGPNPHPPVSQPPMPARRSLALTALAAAGLLATGCALRQAPTAGMPGGQWSGRLALAVRGEPPQSFSAGFELRGRAQAGELLLTSALGTTLALARWTPQGAELQATGERRRFGSMEALLEDVTGAALPLEALFDWLQGLPTAVAGWQTDLSLHAQGRLLARRLSPGPAVELRIALEQP